MGRGVKRKITDLQIRKSLIRHEGAFKAVAQELDVTTETIKRRMKANPRIEGAWIDIQEGYKDKAIKTIMDHIEGGSLKASTYLLDYLGSDRGFGGKQKVAEVDPNNKQGITMNQLDTSTMDASMKKLLLESLENQKQKIEEGEE